MRTDGKPAADILILQRVVPHYRVALFDEIYARTGAKVVTAASPPSGTFLKLGDLHDHPWVVPAPIRFPDPDNAFRAEVPLEAILEAYQPRSIVAEFGLRMSSSEQLAHARRAGRLQSYAFWTHGWQMERGFNSPMDAIVQNLRLTVMRKANALGAYSEEGANWLRARLPKTPVVTLGNALDDRPMREAAAAASVARLGSPQLIGIGRLSADKRFDALIEVFRRVRLHHPTAALTIIGDGPERGALETLAGADLGHGVNFAGALYSEAELAPHFIGADFLVIPGSAGLSVNHALAYGLPVVAFARGPGAPRHHPEIEYVVDGQSGILVRPPVAEAMADRISQAISRGEHHAMRQNLSHYSPAPTIGEVAANFETLFALLQGRPERGRDKDSAPNKTTPAEHRQPPSPSDEGRIAFLWENFGPMHHDRCAAVAKRFGATDAVIGLELFSKSETYEWRRERAVDFRKITLFASASEAPWWRRVYAIIAACRRERVRVAFLCHYQRPEIFAAAAILRAFGVRTFVMNDSKFDDYPRHLWREILKALGYVPYIGGIAASRRSKDYMRFLGRRLGNIQIGYDSISIDRIRTLAERSAPVPFEERDFLVVARMVPKKNLGTAIEAFRIFADGGPKKRKLHICGSGPLEETLRRQVAVSGLDNDVIFHGFEQIEVIAQRISGALALLLPSTEEQFGFVAAEALALGIPVILSPNCGACDELIRTGVNGFVVEPDNPEGMATFMTMLSDQEPLWSRMSCAATSTGRKADVGVFVDAVDALLSVERRPSSLPTTDAAAA